MRSLGIFSGPKGIQGAVKNVAEAAIGEIQESFAGEKDPYDRPWPKNLRGGQTLTDTARLRRSFTRKLFSNGFQVGTNVKYAAIHQYGGEIIPKRKQVLRFKVGQQYVSAKRVQMPARPFVPEPELSPRWEKAFEDALRHYLGGLF